MELEIKQRKGQSCMIDKPPSPKAEEKIRKLPRKEFILRNSRLTDLLEDRHLRSVYNICLALFVLVCLHLTILYSIDSERFKKNISTVTWAFSKFHIVAAIWFAMNFSIVFMLYPTFRFWATTRSEIIKNRQKDYDALFCTLYIVHQLGLFLFPATAVVMYDLPPGSSITVLVEQFRLMMKTHAFVMENATRALRYKPHRHDGDKEDSKPCPKVGKLIYFLFAPTLVYRDNYPRTPFIRWSYVAWNFLQVIACMLAAYITVFHFYVEVFKKTGIEPIPLVNFIEIFTMSVFASSLILFLVFYGCFHCWLNAFSEMLRFGDRMFYNDWWNSTSYAEYYRSWSTVVSDWLYTYIYRDMHTIVKQRPVFAKIVVVILSALIHEYLHAVTNRFVFPILFIIYSTFGVILLFVSRKQTSSLFNAFFWALLFQGCGIIGVCYSLEMNARINCPGTLDTWLDYVVPRSFTCNIISLK